MQTTILLLTLALMLVTLVLILRAVLAVDGPDAPPTIHSTRQRLLFGLIVVGVIVSVASLREWPHRAAGAEAQVVHITSGQWWWDTDTTEIALGQQVEFRVSTEDVNHGLGIYDPNMRLLVQVQAMPGYVNSVVHTFDTTGTHSILCMEYCGVAHHDMTYEFDVVEENS